jgi:hypothetical protein
MVVIGEADHSFNVPRRAAISPEQMLDRLAELVLGWLAADGGQRSGGS